MNFILQRRIHHMAEIKVCENTKPEEVEFIKKNGGRFQSFLR